MERDNYGKAVTTSLTPPNLQRAYYASDKKDEIVMEFDQPVKWDKALASQFYLDGAKGQVTSGSVSENLVTLKLAAASTAQFTYLDSSSWSQKNAAPWRKWHRRPDFLRNAGSWLPNRGLDRYGIAYELLS